MTELEKMIAGELYNPLVPELEEARTKAKTMCMEYNNLPIDAQTKKQRF